MGVKELCASLKNRSVQSLILWAIAVLIVIIVVSIKRTAGSLVGCIMVVILVFEINFLNRFANFKTFTIATFITIFIGYFMALSTMVLLPLDVSMNVIARGDQNWEESKDHQHTFLICWNVLYWGMFALNTFIFKLQLIYSQAGHLRFVKKLAWTLKTYLKQLLILIVVFAVLCIIVAAAFKINGFSSVKGALLILVNVYGLIVLTFLLGYGLVQFPWFVWSCSYPEYLLKCELSKSDDFFQKNRESQVELNEAAKTYQNVIEKIPKGHDLYGYVQYLKDEMPKLEEMSASFARTVGSDIKAKNKKETAIDLNAIQNINEDMIAAARTNLKLKIYNLEKWESKWKKHCDFIFSIADMDNLSGSSGKRDSKEKLINKSINARSLNLFWIIFYRLLAFAIFGFSMLIIFSESTLVFGSHDQVLAFSKMVKSSGENNLFFLLVLLILAFLSYFILCSYFALFRTEKGLVFELTTHQTHSTTMMRSCTICLNLATPLCYNLMMLFNEINTPKVNDIEYSSAFSEFFVPMKKVPFFGDHYNTIVPLFIALIGFFTAFKFVGRYLARLTKGIVKLEVAEINQEKITKGEKSVLAEWERRKRKVRQDEIATERSESLASSKAALESSKKTELSSPSKSITKPIEKPIEKKIENTINDSRFTEEQKEEIRKQDEISQEISKDLDISLNKNEINNDLSGGQLKSEDPMMMEEFRGYLYKKNKVNSWKKRYFCVLNNALCYYTDTKLSKKKGDINFTDIKEIKLKASKKKKNAGKKFEIIVDKRKYVLKSENEKDTKKWVDFLNYSLNMYQINRL